jgi:hypothetical protein
MFRTQLRQDVVALTIASWMEAHGQRWARETVRPPAA